MDKVIFGIAVKFFYLPERSLYAAVKEPPLGSKLMFESQSQNR
jgi:hypothetical protein